MKSIRKPLMFLTVGSLALFAQDKPKITIKVGPSEPPLRPATCTESGYGYLHIDGRTNLTAQEIGEYVIADSRDGKILKIYPQSKGGIFVYAECPNRQAKASQ